MKQRSKNLLNQVNYTRQQVDDLQAALAAVRREFRRRLEHLEKTKPVPPPPIKPVPLFDKPESLRFRLKDLWNQIEDAHQQALNLQTELDASRREFRNRMGEMEELLVEINWYLEEQERED